MYFSSRLERAMGFFSPFQSESVHSECYDHHIFLVEAVELVTRFFSGVFYL